MSNKLKAIFYIDLRNLNSERDAQLKLQLTVLRYETLGSSKPLSYPPNQN